MCYAQQESEGQDERDKRERENVNRDLRESSAKVTEYVTVGTTQQMSAVN